jgi:MFS family permease
MQTALRMDTTRLLSERSLVSSFKRALLGCISPLVRKINIPPTRWQQLTGINFIFYYGTTFFKHSGIADAFLITVATNVVNVFMTLPGMWGIERFGRRRLLLIGAAGMCFCEFIIAIVGVTISVNNIAGQKVLVAFVCIYIVRFIPYFCDQCSDFFYLRHSLPQHGDPSLGSSLVRSFHWLFEPRQCRSLLRPIGALCHVKYRRISILT